MENMLWDLIIVGRGSAAAYYLSTLDRSMFLNIMVIGEADPWAGERGYNSSAPNDVVNFINHSAQMIQHLSDRFPEFSTDLVDRLDFAKANAEIVDQFSTAVLEAKVTNIEEVMESAMPAEFRLNLVPAPMVFKVTTDAVSANIGAQSFYGKKIVVATGAGPHRVPLEVKDVKPKTDRIMDMDEFGRRGASLGNPRTMTVFVMGPNAAIDSADTAGFKGYTVKWLVKSTNSIPMLATGHQVHAQAIIDKTTNNGSEVVRYGDKGRTVANFAVELTGKTPPIRVTIDGQPPMEGDVFVYGAGQEPDDAIKGVVPQGFLSRLQPIYDINQRFGAAHQTVVGLKLENSSFMQGFEVIGALATQVVRKTTIQHTYKQELVVRIEEARTKVLSFLNGAFVEMHTRILTTPLANLEDMSPGDVRMKVKEARAWVEKRYPTWKDRVGSLCALLLNWIVVAPYFDNKKGVSEADLTAAARILTPSVIQGPQLGAIRSQTCAMNGAAPGYIGSQLAEYGSNGKYVGSLTTQGNRANFSSDDQQVLRLYIALNFPFISEEDSERFIKDVIARRPDPKNGGWGFKQADSQRFEEELDRMNDRGAAVLRTPKTFGSGQTANNSAM